MPVTPLHVGPGILVCRLWGRLGCGAVIAGSVLVDLEPGAVMLLGLDARLHGPMHTLAAASLVGWLAGLVGWLVWSRLGAPLRASGPWYAMLGGIVGWALHVVLDSFLYTDIRPLDPVSRGNPLLGSLGAYTLEVVYLVTGLLTVWGLLWLYRVLQVGRAR